MRTNGKRKVAKGVTTRLVLFNEARKAGASSNQASRIAQGRTGDDISAILPILDRMDEAVALLEKGGMDRLNRVLGNDLPVKEPDEREG